LNESTNNLEKAQIRMNHCITSLNTRMDIAITKLDSRINDLRVTVTRLDATTTEKFDSASRLNKITIFLLTLLLGFMFWRMGIPIFP